MINYNECDVRDTEYFKAFIFKNSSGEECLVRLMINQTDNGILDLNKFEELKDIVVVGFRNVELATVVSDDYFDTLVLPHWVERINGCAFRRLKVRHVIWPDSCPLIPYGDFLDSSIKAISNIDSVRALGDEAFKNSKLKSITIPEQVSRIPFCCFSHCSSLSEVKGMENVRIIFSGAFSCCENLHSISLDKVVNIHSYAFCNSGIQTVDLSKSLCCSIGQRAFIGSKVESYTPGYFLQEVDPSAFMDTPYDTLSGLSRGLV